MIRTAINDWTALYLEEVKGYQRHVAIGLVCWFEAGGFFGALVAGWSSDFLFKGKRGPVNAIYAFFILIMLVIFWKVTLQFWIIDSVLLFLIGFFVFGPQMLIGIAAAELSHKKAVGTATGFTGIFSYVGAAAAGLPIGNITETWAWSGFFIALIICGIISTALLSVLWPVDSKS